jgi:hypothetical protein
VIRTTQAIVDYIAKAEPHATVRATIFQTPDPPVGPAKQDKLFPMQSNANRLVSNIGTAENGMPVIHDRHS